MVSFAYPKHLPIVAEVAKTFVLDNGAFSAWTKGDPLDTQGYYAWVDEWKHHPGFQWALIPDVIDGDEKENDRLIFDQTGGGWPASLQGYGVPVWHLHESLGRLARLAGAFRTIALGSSGKYATPGTESWWQRIDEAFGRLTAPGHPPRVRIHGLRMLSREIFPHLPFASADSTNAAQNAGSVQRFGMYPAPEAWQRANAIADRIESENSAAMWMPRARTAEALFA